MIKEITFSSKAKADAYVKKMKKTHMVVGPSKIYVVDVGKKIKKV